MSNFTLYSSVLLETFIRFASATHMTCIFTEHLLFVKVTILHYILRSSDNTYLLPSFFTMGLTLERLPDEIVQNILSFLQPKSITAVLETSTRLNRIANEPALWRHYCLRDFQRWDETHRIHHIRAAGLSSTNWQLLYRRRVLTDRTTTKILNSILATQQSRVAKFQEIVDQGYDTKDTLLRHLQVGDDAEDVLARR